MNRRQTRYWLFRIQTEVGGGAKANPPEGLRERFEKDPFFRTVSGWKGFGRKWDVTEEEPFTLIPVTEDLWEAWDKHCASVAKEIPKAIVDVIQAPRIPFKKKASIEAVMKFS